MVSLENGQTLPTTENTLSPVEILGDSTTPGNTLPQESHASHQSPAEQPLTPSQGAHDPNLPQEHPDIHQFGQPHSQPGQSNSQQGEADPHHDSSGHDIGLTSGERHLNSDPEDEHGNEEDNLPGPAEPSSFVPGISLSHCAVERPKQM